MGLCEPSHDICNMNLCATSRLLQDVQRFGSLTARNCDSSDLNQRLAMRSRSNSPLRARKSAETARKACSPDHPPASKAREARRRRSHKPERGDPRRIFEFSRQVIAVHRIELSDPTRRQPDGASRRCLGNQALAALGPRDEDVHAGSFSMDRLSISHQPTIWTGNVGEPVSSRLAIQIQMHRKRCQTKKPRRLSPAGLRQSIEL